MRYYNKLLITFQPTNQARQAFTLDWNANASGFRDFFSSAGDELLERVRAWGVFFPDEALRKNPDALAKIDNYANDFGKSFDVISNEFANVPASQRLTWGDHLEFRTNGKQVNKTANKPGKFNSFNSNSAVPNRYTSDSRFNDLASDPDHGGNITVGSRREATAGLEAESQGLIPSPISRDPNGAEFIDGNGGY